MQTPLLVSCIGAYQDSGVGTGGCIAVLPSGDVIEIDSLDSTGLYHLNGNYYRYVRALRKLAVYTQEGLKALINLPQVADVHDILFHDGHFIVISTGSNEIHWYDLQWNLVKKWNPGGTDDAWHLNCAWIANGELYFTAFGDFSTHRGWDGNAKGAGFLMRQSDQQIIIDGLSGPHTPRLVDEKWWICDSHAKRVTIATMHDKKTAKHIDLGGFTRGMYCAAANVYVGLSADRKDPNSLEGSIVEIRKADGEVFRRIAVPFPEIYDILPVSEAFVEALRTHPDRFKITSSEDAEVENLKLQLKATELTLVKERKKKSLLSLLKRGYKVLRR